ncbi:MAG TPA: MFS transporter [Stellaceae bacterium]|nr:MFS transporter [Stellaceae bacterium]
MVAMAMERGPQAALKTKLPFIVGAVSVGTLLEWYGFYLYSGLSGSLTPQFFPDGLDHGILYSIGIFWTGFAVRPVGAVLFGHVGDRIGRKFALVATLSTMGAASFVMGCLPGFASAGWAAPLLLVLCRLAQGVAMGGEYGGAVTYVAEQAPAGKRGLYTSWLQTTATLGIVLALLVILCCRLGLGDRAFADWGWRVPFWLGAVLVGLSIYIRQTFDESPLFARMKQQGRLAANPARESFSDLKNGRLMGLALFGAAAPEGVIWYTGQFYALDYLTTVLKLPYVTVQLMMMVVLLGAAPFFVVFGALSDRVGRRNVMTLGFLLAAISYWPVFSWMAAVKDSPLLLGVLVFYMVLLAAMVYGPIAAFLVEIFPARVRYTSMALPYHVGNGVFGGLVPIAGAAIATALGGPLYGLLYPIGLAALGVAVSIAGLPARSDAMRDGEGAGGPPPPTPGHPPGQLPGQP